jgi:hypothetical protein
VSDSTIDSQEVEGIDPNDEEDQSVQVPLPDDEPVSDGSLLSHIITVDDFGKFLIEAQPSDLNDERNDDGRDD